MIIFCLVIEFAIISLNNAAGSTVMMMDSSLTVREGQTVSVCVVSTLSPGQSVEVGLMKNNQQGWHLAMSTRLLYLQLEAYMSALQVNNVFCMP